MRCEVCGADHEHERADDLVGAFCCGVLFVLVLLGSCAFAGWVQ